MLEKLPVKRVSFFDAVTDTTGGNEKIQRGEYLPEGRLPIIDQGQSDIAGFTDSTAAEYRGTLPVVLFGDHTRAFKYVDFPFALGADGVKVLTPKDGFDAAFLHYYFRSVSLPNAGYSRHFKFLKEIWVPKPPLPEQRRLVDLLTHAEGIVRLRREAQQKAAEIIPALFLDMFGDPATNPTGWPIQRFERFGVCRLGKMLDKKKQTGEFQRPYLRNINVQWDRIDTSDVLTMDFHPEEQETFLVRHGDVLICEGGEIGRAAVWRGSSLEIYYQKALHKLTPDPGLIRPDFVVWLLWHLAKAGTLLGASTHATIAHLTGIQLRNLSAVCPPIELQTEFERRVEQLHSIRSQQAAALAKAEATFNALLAQVFSPAAAAPAVRQA
jgi:type I restriction enzyme, S subunit